MPAHPFWYYLKFKQIKSTGFLMAINTKPAMVTFLNLFPHCTLYKNLLFQSTIHLICIQSFQSVWIATQNDGLSHIVIIIIWFLSTNFSNNESKLDTHFFVRFWIWPCDGRCTLHYTPNKHIKFKIQICKILYIIILNTLHNFYTPLWWSINQ